MRLRSPIKTRGAVAARWERWKEQSRREVARRADFECEACGSRMRPLEWAHLAGRNNKGIGEPWASSPALTAALCSGKWDELGCHEKIDRALAPALLKGLRTDALVRLCANYGLGISEIVGTYTDPLDAIREATRRLAIAGWEYDPDRNAIVRP